MDAVLIVSNTGSTLGIISDLLKSQPLSRIVAAQSGSAARRQLIDGDFDLIIIDAPLADEHGEDVALRAAETTSAGIIVITQVETLYDVSAAVEDSGVFVLPKPVSPEFFYQSVKLLRASRSRLLKLEAENRRLYAKLEETRTVDRAKCALVRHRGMTEPQAHRYIEKQSMDARQSKTVTAENILRVYEEA